MARTYLTLKLQIKDYIYLSRNSLILSIHYYFPYVQTKLLITKASTKSINIYLFIDLLELFLLLLVKLD